MDLQYPIDTSNLNDGYILIFDYENLKYKFVNPDEVLSLAVTDPQQPGLPSDFLSLLEVDLDNKINLDGGNW
jgi:hypothetical protein